MKSSLPPFSFLPAALLAVVGSTLASSGPAFAFSDNEQITDIQTTPGSAGLGYVLKVEPSPYKDAKTSVELKPLFLYEGERVFLHSSRVGVKLFDSPEQRLDVFLDKRLEGFPIKSPPASLSGMAIRHSSTDAGLSYRYKQAWGTLQAELLHGVSDTQSGTEARLGYSTETQSGRWTLRPSVTLAWRNAKLNDYYYGVTLGEASAGRPAYSAGAGLNLGAHRARCCLTTSMTAPSRASVSCLRCMWALRTTSAPRARAAPMPAVRRPISSCSMARQPTTAATWSRSSPPAVFRPPPTTGPTSRRSRSANPLLKTSMAGRWIWSAMSA
jgi:outer membrane scaffolding protein for murein synthesis (MipA/OmpV family)